jgi:ribosomal protein S12 methylthiotransferase accessory factor
MSQTDGDADWLDSMQQRAEECLRRAKPAVGDRYGLIRHVWDIATEPDDARLFHAVAQAADGRPLFGRNRADFEGGAGHTPQVARAGAIGETLERYAASAYDETALVSASYRQLGDEGLNAVDPASFPLYSEAQYRSPGFPFAPLREETRIRWAWATSLVSGRGVLVPARLVYLGFTEDALIGETISTGLACGLSPTGAALSGLKEVVERDAIMIMWRGKLAAPQVDVEALPRVADVYETMFRPSGLEFTVVDITTDLGIPVAFALAVDRANDGIALNAGAAANAEPDGAVFKALVEAAQGRLWLRKEHLDGRVADVLDPGDVNTFDDHVRWFGHQQHLRHVSFLTDERGRDAKAANFATTSDGGQCAPDRLQALTTRLAGHGFDVIVVDVTPPDVADLGFTIVKVLVPGLVDLNCRHRLPFNGNHRLYEVPERLGHGPRTEAELNDIPHPFP